ncbi:MAG: nuclear transport factor 2 family protein [Acidimicrobiales bacterium]
MTDQTEPIHGCIDQWHEQLRGRLEGGLDAILHPDCVFWSPIVFTAQEGRELTKLYLTAAGGTLGGDDGPVDESKPASTGGFAYVTEILQGHHAMLEFETTVEGKYVNGVDIITCDDDGLITEFKVMIRPLQAINLVHEQMRAMLETLNG